MSRKRTLAAAEAEIKYLREQVQDLQQQVEDLQQKNEWLTVFALEMENWTRAKARNNGSRDKKIVAMRDVNKLTFGQIARDLNMKRSAVEKAYSRFKKNEIIF
jgi:hypothetical protein